MSMRRIPPATKARALRMFTDGVPAKKITAATGVCHHTINRWRRAAGMAGRKGGPKGYDPSVRAKAIEMYRTQTSEAVGAKFKVAPNTVTNWARAAGVVGEPRDHHQVPKATRELAVKMYRKGEPMRNIEAATGSDRQTIRDWAREAGVPARTGNNLQNRTRT